MLMHEFDYRLPPALIAQQPCEPRHAARLLRVHRRQDPYHDACINDLPHLLRPDDLLVFNDTKVIPARLRGSKSTGGKVEILLERLLDDNQALVQIKASKPPQPGSYIELKADIILEVCRRQGELYVLKATLPWLDILHQAGEVPLPPYIRRALNPADRSRYQTIFAAHAGAVAAPTAGLHFDQPLFNGLARQGIDWTFITLHVGLATFQPVRVQRVQEHVMHAERMWVGDKALQKIHHCRQRGGRIIAVGTTCVRCLESLPEPWPCRPVVQSTQKFIYPGYRFRHVDAIITNFHLPKSSLLLLVSAFAGKQKILSAYQAAIERGYRFYSYGDAMLLE